MSAEKFLEILEGDKEIALATSVGNVPNVRIVNVCCKPGQPGVLLFMSSRDNHKVEEFAQNDTVAFTSVPKEGIAHVRSVRAVVRKSALTLKDVEQLFVSAIPDYGETIAAIGDTLDVFEIRVTKTMIITGFGEPEWVEF
ncbi:MAG: pyridoxamine 5'-phosphate oxidase family protein [Synergistaceae bacterium]|jgi:uncharacterized pyridoxamine 5'-phosphate oxidase family protein|nr:pyridoxamine 5'-phosphate oxidase family protein [Synergistaceae bacterium]